MENELVLQIRELRKAFGDQKVLDGIDLDVKKGETLTILGRSGSGKSVLLKLIIGLQKPDSGSIRIGDAEVTGDVPAAHLGGPRRPAAALACRP